MLIGIDIGNTRTKGFRLPETAPPESPHVEWVDSRPCFAAPSDDIDTVLAEIDILLEAETTEIGTARERRSSRARRQPHNHAHIHIVGVRPRPAEALTEALSGGWRFGDYDLNVVTWDSSSHPIPMSHPYDDSATLGPDRLLTASAAYWLTASPTVIVDAGTAITVDVVDEAGRFLGGAIAPGRGLLAESLGRGGAMLHVVDSDRTSNDTDDDASRFHYPGRSTVECLHLGIEAAFRGAVRELVERAVRHARESVADHEPDDANGDGAASVSIVITGGDAAAVMTVLDNFVPIRAVTRLDVVSHLSAIGLALLAHRKA